MRKDVVNKCILRGFKKSIVNLFKPKRILPCRLKQKISTYKNTLIEEAINFGIINLDMVEANPN